MAAKKFAFDTPNDALVALGQSLSVTTIENSVDAEASIGRVLANTVVADRDSPAADVSAMDGYAIRLCDLQQEKPITVAGESAPGAPPPSMQDGAVVRIFTGAIVPDGCDAVVKREDTEELEETIRFREAAMTTSLGEHIRRSGENAKSGSSVLTPGIRISAAHHATMANFGCRRIDLFSPVRVSIITTGDEVGKFDKDPPKPWQLRNSNRQSLTALLKPIPWIKIQHIDHCKDDRGTLTDLLRQRLSQSDALLLTGGVSMGDYDYVPDVVRELGGNVIFHGLPIRPGKPILGAATDDGKLIMGLPGNPVSATIGCHRMALPLLSKQSGQTEWIQPTPLVQLANPGDKTIPLHWLRLVRISRSGIAELVASQGSGDLVSLGQSTGFVELPPSRSGDGPWPYHAW